MAKETTMVEDIDYPPAPPETEQRLIEPLTLEEGPEGAETCHPLPKPEQPTES